MFQIIAALNRLEKKCARNWVYVISRDV